MASVALKGSSSGMASIMSVNDCCSLINATLIFGVLHANTSSSVYVVTK